MLPGSSAIGGAGTMGFAIGMSTTAGTEATYQVTVVQFYQRRKSRITTVDVACFDDFDVCHEVGALWGASLGVVCQKFW